MKLKTKMLYRRSKFMFKLSKIFDLLYTKTINKACDLLLMYRAACDNENVDAVIPRIEVYTDGTEKIVNRKKERKNA